MCIILRQCKKQKIPLKKIYYYPQVKLKVNLKKRKLTKNQMSLKKVKK